MNNLDGSKIEKKITYNSLIPPPYLVIIIIFLLGGSTSVKFEKKQERVETDCF